MRVPLKAGMRQAADGPVRAEAMACAVAGAWAFSFSAAFVRLGAGAPATASTLSHAFLLDSKLSV